MKPLVSILVPAFNAAPWIAATLESALAQTHHHREIIVVDDGSRDETLDIARSYQARGVRVISQTNAGASAARNHAIRVARGELLQFLDADDLLSTRKIELQIDLLAKHPTGTLATCRWGRFDTDASAARCVDEAVFRDFSPLDFLLLHTSEAATMHPAAWLVPRAVAERVGPWDESLSLNDDGEYFARVVLASAGLAFVPSPEATSFYRTGLAGSLSRRRSPAAMASLFRSVEQVSAHLLAAENTPRVRRALADYWQRLCHELYPADPIGSRAAARQATDLGGSQLKPPMGKRARRLARLIGWRLVYRLSRPQP